VTSHKLTHAMLFAALIGALLVAGCVPSTSQARRAACPDPRPISVPDGELTDIAASTGAAAGPVRIEAPERGVPSLFYAANPRGEFQIFRIPIGENLQPDSVSAPKEVVPQQLTYSDRGQGNSNVTPAASRSGFVAFASNRTGNYEIYLMRADGSGQTRLTNTPGHEVGPAISADGRIVAFTSDCYGNEDVFIASTNGKTLQRVTSSPQAESAPDISPDGSLLAYKSEVDGSPRIYVADIDGTNSRRLTANRFPESSPAFSPDGKWVAYQALIKGKWQIRVVSINGDSDHSVVASGANDTRPRWSPDGRFIYFVSDRDGHDAVYVASSDGSTVARVVGDSYEARSPAIGYA
jgi:Tol biopolymer transport system component